MMRGLIRDQQQAYSFQSWWMDKWVDQSDDLSSSIQSIQSMFPMRTPSGPTFWDARRCDSLDGGPNPS